MINYDWEKRFWEKVNKDGSVSDFRPELGKCWIWMSTKSKSGYSRFKFKNRTKEAYRICYELIKGKIPNGLHLDHLCRIRHCVNPDHLEVVTPTENWIRGFSPHAKNKKKTHCDKGHEFTEENTIIRKDRLGTRECRFCQNQANKKFRMKKRKAAGIFPKGQEPFCKKGHLFSPENTDFVGKNKKFRRCKICFKNWKIENKDKFKKYKETYNQKIKKLSPN